MKGFKEFIARGNLIEMAVALAIGLAFVALIQSVLDNIISPVINSVGASDTKPGLGFYIKDGNPSTFINLSGVVNAVIIFLCTAAAIYFLIVLPYQKYKEARGIVEEEAGPSDTELLTEIRDLLAQQNRV